LKLSIVIPVYNEAPILKQVLERVFAVKFPLVTEFIIIDDHSTDKSWDIIEAVAKEKPLKIFRQPQNSGKGAALRQGFSLVTGDIVAVHDADFEYDPEDLVSLLEPIVADKADVVFGSRFRSNSPQVHRTFHYLGNHLLTLLSNVMSGLYLTDMETCYKIFPAEVIKALPLTSNRFGFEPEVTAFLAKLNIRVHEYPISYQPRTYVQGKKINWKDGIAAFWFICKYNLQKLDQATLKKLPERYHPRDHHWL
jgi:glycosyltransferase involved in cell wall biosynthesis